MSRVWRLGEWLLWLSVLVSGPLQAHQTPEYERQVPPAYPRVLYEKGISGLVLVEFRGHNDGSVTDVQIIESSDGNFAKSVERAITKWRLKPWQASAEAPELVHIRQEFYFTHSRERQDPHTWMRRYVRVLSCSGFNKALATLWTNSPSQNVHDMHYITYTFRVLGRSATRLNMTDDQRAEVGDEFVRAIPDTVQRCRAQPDLRYKETLPKRAGALI